MLRSHRLSYMPLLSPYGTALAVAGCLCINTQPALAAVEPVAANTVSAPKPPAKTPSASTISASGITDDSNAETGDPAENPEAEAAVVPSPDGLTSTNNATALVTAAIAAAINTASTEAAKAAERDPIPKNVRMMLEEALSSGDNSELNTIVKYTRRTNPEATDAIQAIVSEHRARVEAQRLATIRQASPFALWVGKIELGGFRSTGSSSEFGVNMAMSATRKGLSWTHALAANADYREANGKKSSERLLASYSPTLQLDTRNFVYGLVQYERDPFVGYDYRYTGSLGIGYTFIDNGKLLLAVTLGPSLREISYIDDGTDTKWGGRSSLNFRWALTPTLSVQQTASAFAEDDTKSVSSRTALDARIITKLSARFSYNMQYETGANLSDRSFDTTSRVTLIYDF
ncbi:MAG: DUF481 domain-containing protein [Sphingobium sp.]|nr:DUF481 domain-containing protein [Sphingobium sp.]